jgi:hypothetical protein
MARVSATEAARAHVLILGGSDEPSPEPGSSRAPPPLKTILSASLPHPRTGESCSFLFVDGLPYELQRVTDGAEGSWLVGQSVQEGARRGIGVS